MATAEAFPGEQEDALSLCILLLREECESSQYQNIISTLLKILRNVISNPNEDKYRELKTTNKTFCERVWKFTSAQQFLVASGWAEVDDKVILLDNQYLSKAVAVLENASRTTQIANGVMEAPSHSGRQQTQKEQLIEECRRKHTEQMKKEKEEKKRISEMIKADRKETQTRKSKDSVARTRQFGGNINNFGDIGVDLNRGGG